MNTFVYIVLILMLLAEFGMIALCYKLNTLRFTIHTILFKIPFIILLSSTLYLDSEIMIGYSMTIYFITIFFQDIFFKKYHNSKISDSLLFLYVCTIFCSVLLVIFDLHVYTLLLNILSIILGVIINRKKLLPSE
jgi:hypothetical protein